MKKRGINWYKAHEIRMWLMTGVAMTGAAYAAIKSHPEIKHKAKEKWEAFKSKFKEEEKPEEIRIVIVKDEETPR